METMRRQQYGVDRGETRQCRSMGAHAGSGGTRSETRAGRLRVSVSVIGWGPVHSPSDRSFPGPRPGASAAAEGSETFVSRHTSGGASIAVRREDGTSKRGSDTTAEYGLCVESPWEARGGFDEEVTELHGATERRRIAGSSRSRSAF